MSELEDLAARVRASHKHAKTEIDGSTLYIENNEDQYQVTLEDGSYVFRKEPVGYESEVEATLTSQDDVMELITPVRVHLPPERSG